jgi:hypothetical protein
MRRPIVAAAIVAAVTIAAGLGAFALSRQNEANAALVALQGDERIVFSSAQDGDADIYLMNDDGTGTLKLTRNDVEDDGALASPDGRWIAFTRHRIQDNVDYGDQWVMRADGTGAHRIRVAASGAEAWSPDGGHILYGDYELERGVLVDVASGSRTIVGPASCCAGAAWSPDGSEIAAVTGGYGVANGIVLIDTKTETWRWAYRGGVGFTRPVWSPDGKRIAFTTSSDSTPPDKRGVAVVAVSSGDVVRIGTSGPEGDGIDQLAWAPASTLVFSRLVGRDRPALFSWDGARTRRLRLPGPVMNPHWAPDGRTLEFTWGRFDSVYGETDLGYYRAGRAWRITPLGETGGFEFGGWSPGPRLPQPGQPRAVRPTAVASLSLRRAELLEVAGHRVAVSNPCGPLVLWRIGSASATNLTAGCAHSPGLTTALALTSSAVAWVFRWTDRMEGEDCIMLADPASGAPLASHHKCDSGGGPGGLPAHIVTAPESIERLVAEGAKVAYSKREWCDPDYVSGCKPYTWVPRGGYVLTERGARKVVAESELLALAGDGYVVRRHGRSEIVYPARHRTVRLAYDAPFGVAVHGSVVAAIGEDGTLRLMSASHGAQLRAIELRPPSADTPRLEDLTKSYAAIVADGQLRVVRLRDGQSIRIVLGTAVSPIHARFDESHLVVSFNHLGSAPWGRVMAFPLAAVDAAFH